MTKQTNSVEGLSADFHGGLRLLRQVVFLLLASCLCSLGLDLLSTVGLYASARFTRSSARKGYGAWSASTRTRKASGWSLFKTWFNNLENKMNDQDIQQICTGVYSLIVTDSVSL